jgi:hypothetical protein
MPWYRCHGLMVHMKIAGKAPAPCVARTTPDNPLVPSQRCFAISTALCDWPLSDGKTCDAPLCPEHATEVGKDRHYCPRHTAEHRASAPELW